MSEEEESLADDLSQEDCIKTAVLILESLTAKGMKFDQQVLVACGMLAVMQVSHPNLDVYKILEKGKREEAQVEVDALFGAGHEI